MCPHASIRQLQKTNVNDAVVMTIPEGVSKTEIWFQQDSKYEHTLTDSLTSLMVVGDRSDV